MSRKRVLLGFSIIAGGACAALPFLREAPLTPHAHGDSAAASSQPILHVLQPLVAAAPPSAAVLAAEQNPAEVPAGPSPYIDDGSQRLDHQLLGSVGVATPLEEITASSREKSTALPLLPVSYQVKQPDELRTAPWQPAKLAEGPAGPPREYRIRKTDTLEDLALRFLGSQERAEELFEANRSVLQDRHILPLGAVIRIPVGSIESPAGESGADLQPVGHPGD